MLCLLFKVLKNLYLTISQTCNIIWEYHIGKEANSDNTSLNKFGYFELQYTHLNHLYPRSVLSLSITITWKTKWIKLKLLEVRNICVDAQLHTSEVYIVQSQRFHFPLSVFFGTRIPEFVFFKPAVERSWKNCLVSQNFPSMTIALLKGTTDTVL